MKKFTVELYETLVSWVDVEAENEAAAKKMVESDMEKHFDDRHSEYSSGVHVQGVSLLD